MTATLHQLPQTPMCPECKGGSEINGIPCRTCQVDVQPGRIKSVSRRFLMRSATGVGTLVRYSSTVPGVAGIGALAYGWAAVIHGIFGQVPELGVALGIAGVFLLLIDRNL